MEVYYFLVPLKLGPRLNTRFSLPLDGRKDNSEAAHALPPEFVGTKGASEDWMTGE